MSSLIMLKKGIVAFFLLFVPVLALAQASGGQIKRHKQTSSAENTRPNNKVQNSYTPVEMSPNLYYLCINETMYERNGQDICRKMATKGYKPELVISSSGFYHVCLKKETSKSVAREFIKSFKDTRYSISYIYYNGELVDIVTEGPTPLDKMKMYNVVIGSSQNLAEAQDLCGDSRHNLLSGDIIYDASTQMYRVVCLSTNSEKEAVDRVNLPYVKQHWPDSWILQVINGQVIKYSK